MWINIWVLTGGIIFLYLLGDCIGYHRKKREIRRNEWLEKLTDELTSGNYKVEVEEHFLEKRDDIKIEVYSDGVSVGRFRWTRWKHIEDTFERSGCLRSLNVDEAYQLRDILLRNSSVNYTDWKIKQKKKSKDENRLGLELLKKIEESK